MDASMIAHVFVEGNVRQSGLDFPFSALEKELRPMFHPKNMEKLLISFEKYALLV